MLREGGASSNHGEQSCLLDRPLCAGDDGKRLVDSTSIHSAIEDNKERIPIPPERNPLQGQITMAKKMLPPIPPGEILLEEFMKPNKISQNRLARDIDINTIPVSHSISRQAHSFLSPVDFLRYHFRYEKKFDPHLPFHFGTLELPPNNFRRQPKDRVTHWSFYPRPRVLSPAPISPTRNRWTRWQRPQLLLFDWQNRRQIVTAIPLAILPLDRCLPAFQKTHGKT